jgi:ParB-like chromosome segregation protein Spo0J
MVQIRVLMKNSLDITWALEERFIKDLSPFDRNPRCMGSHESKKLRELLETFGLIDKPIITRSNVIIGGHQRIESLKKMRIKKVECYVPDKDLDESDIRKLNIGLNRAVGEFDWDILSNSWGIDDMLAGGLIPEELFGKERDDAPKEGKKKNLKQCPNCGHEF